MKKFKKTLSLIATISILATYMVAPITAKADTTLFSDDFEAHAVTDAIAGTTGIAQTIVDGYWETSATSGGDTNNQYKIGYDVRYGNGYNSGNVAIDNKTIILKPHAGEFSAAANLTYDTGSAENYTFTVDVRNSYGWSQTPVSGIRLYDPDNETNYYELALITPQEPNNYVYSNYEGALAGSFPPRFTKVEGANASTAATKADTEIPDEWKVTAYSPEPAVTMLHQVKNLDNPSDLELRTTWYTLSITKIGDTICWSVYDKERNATVWEASYKDEAPLFSKMGKLQLFVYGNGADNDIFFDNVTLASVDAGSFQIPPAATLTEKTEPEPEPEPDEEEEYTPTVSTPDTPLYLFRDTVEGYKVYSPVGTKAEDITNNVPSYATGFGGNVSDVLVDGYWQTSAVLGGNDWFNDYCVQYDETTGNGWGDGVVSPIRYSGSNPDKSNKVIALQPTYNEKGQLCVLNLAKNIGDSSDFIYSVDVRNFFAGSVNPVAGIRIADPTDDTSYYELALISKGEIYNVDREGAKLQMPRFTKVKYGSKHTASAPVGTELKYAVQGPVGTASGMYNDGGYKTSWFTLTLAKKGNTLYWRIYDKAYNEVVWEDTYTDPSPLFSGMGRLQLFAYSGGKVQAPTFFDNIEARKLGSKLFHYEDVGETITDAFEKEAISSAPSGYNSDVSFSINYDKLKANAWGGASDTDITENKVIWLNGSGKLNYTKEIANTYSVDLRNYFNGSTNPVMGIRLLDPDNASNYYELAILSGTGVYNSFAEGKLYPPRFTKVKGAKDSTPAISPSQPDEVLYLENGTEKTASALVAELTAGIGHSTYWYTLELSKAGNDISFKVIDKESGALLWSKTWTDDNPLFDDAGSLQIFTYGGGSSVLVDNVESTQIGDSGLRIEASWINESGSLPKLMTADYDSDGRLISASEIVAGVDYYFSPESIKMKGTSKKFFLWDAETMKPLCEPAEYQEGDIEKCLVTYPNFSTKAFTVSIDDGSSSDSLIMPIMKQYGIKGTFNLTQNVPSNIYDYKHENFEIANHTTHIEMYSGNYSYDDCVASIADAHSAILSKARVDSQGVIWPYRAPKNLSFWKDLYAYVSQRYEYARETGETYGFSAPLDWMQWSATAWSDNWRTYTDKFIKAEYTDELQMLALAGHAFDQPQGEASMSELCKYVFSTIASDENIWKATNIELCKYIKATKQLEISSKNVYNPSKDTAVYMIIDGKEYVAYPQSYAEPYDN